MKQVKTIDREIARNICKEADVVLEAVAKRMGLRISPSRGRFSSEELRITLEFSVIDPTGKTREAKDYEELAVIYGLPKNSLGKSIRVYGEQYVIEGLKPRSRKYPILAKRADGKRFKLPIAAVKQALGI